MKKIVAEKKNCGLINIDEESKIKGENNMKQNEPVEINVGGLQVIFMRHAKQRKDQGRDPFLAEEGQKEADNVADLINRFQPDEVYSSTMKRAEETAQRQSAQFGITPKLDDRLVIPKQPWSPDSSLPPLQQWEKGIIDVEPKEGDETNEEVFARVKSFVDMLKQNKNNSKRILVVAHGGIVQYLAYAALNETYDKEKFRKQFGLVETTEMVGVDLGLPTEQREMKMLLSTTDNKKRETFVDWRGEEMSPKQAKNANLLNWFVNNPDLDLGR